MDVRELPESDSLTCGCEMYFFYLYCYLLHQMSSACKLVHYKQENCSMFIQCVVWIQCQ